MVVLLLRDQGHEAFLVVMGKIGQGLARQGKPLFRHAFVQHVSLCAAPVIAPVHPVWGKPRFRLAGTATSISFGSGRFSSPISLTKSSRLRFASRAL